MSTQVFFIAAQARDTLVIPVSALNFKVRKPGDSEDDKADKKSKDTDSKKDAAKDKSSTASAEGSAKEGLAKESSASSAATESADAKGKRGERGERTREQASGESAGEERWARKRGQGQRRAAPPSATDEVKPQPATVQVMDEKGNLTERKIMVGISSRVRVQVLEGLQEGDKVVSGMRQQEKANSSSQGAMPGAQGMGGPGGGGGGARQMR